MQVSLKILQLKWSKCFNY